MSTSPCCASAYKFPALSPSQGCAADLLTTIGGLAVTLPGPIMEGGDYFDLRNPTLSMLSKASHSALRMRKPGSSLSSMTSSSTVVDSSEPVLGFFVSTDTLVDDQGQPPLAKKPVLSRRPLGSSVSGLSQFSMQPSASFTESGSRSATEPLFSFPSAETQRSPLKSATTFSGFSPTRSQSSVLTSVDELGKSVRAKSASRIAPAGSDMRESILRLSPQIKPVCAGDMYQILASSTIDVTSSLPSHLVIDIRLLAEFVKNHVSLAINVCLPLTLLKRVSFDFRRCVNSLPAYEKTIFQNYLHHHTASGTGLPTILLYDSRAYSANLYHFCKKLVDSSFWGTAEVPVIYILEDSYVSFAADHADRTSSGNHETIDVFNLAIKPNVEPVALLEMPQLPDNTSPRYQRSQSTPGLSVVIPHASTVVTPTVSNFSLPQALPRTKFKIRQNEEVTESIENSMLEEFNLHCGLTTPQIKELPGWIRAPLEELDSVKAAFCKLQDRERARLNGALSMEDISNIETPGGHSEMCPRVTYGLDYGHKNRYKDVFVFDHSRVTLRAYSTSNGSEDSDYINASYILPLSKMSVDPAFLTKITQYIATQGPLEGTSGDFWRCVYDHKTPLVIALTGESELGVVKCYPYWKLQSYMSGGEIVRVELQEEINVGGTMLRSYVIQVGENGPLHHTLQAQISNWEDMSTTVSIEDVLAIIALKKYVLSHIKNSSAYPTIIHCSAGCGRTGVFCAVDSILSLLDHNGRSELASDPIFNVVNNMRSQRVLMVQTYRQYCFVYGIIARQLSNVRVHDSLVGTGLVQQFLKDSI